MFPLYRLFVFFIAEILIGFFFLFFIYLSLKNFKKTDLLSLGLLGSLFAFFSSETIKSLFPIARPENPLIGYREGSSFPSTHSAVAFSLAFAVFLINKRWGYVFYALAVLIALGRFLGGVHTLLDVFFGAVLGTFCTYLVYKYSVHLIFGKKK